MGGERSTWGAPTATAPEAEAAVPVATAPLEGLPERYEDLGVLGRGGNGEVRRVHDTVLDRELAMKVLSPRVAPTPERLARLRAEALLTAGLQHPGVVPVHDCGALADGRVWYTMKVVEGVTFALALDDVSAGARRRWSPRSLLASFTSICQTVAFAHSRGVVHRDLKPGNVMLGAFGEVLVVDWGLAASVGPDSEGRVEGTPAYMAPEQARGLPGAWEPPVDVFALGRILGDILDAGALPARRLTPLRRAVARAISPEPEARGAASDLLAAVQGWLDGERAHEEALAVVARADALRPRIAALEAEAEAHRARAEGLLAALPADAPLEERERAWDEEEAAADKEQRARQTRVEWQELLRSALNHDPELAEAHDRLADHHLARLRQAEARRDEAAAAAAAWLLEQHDRGRYRAVIEGTGALTLTTDPPGARVSLLRFTPRRRRLEAGPPEVLGVTPLEAHPLTPGSYLLLLELDGHELVRYPVHLERQAHWHAREPVCLPPRGSLAPDVALVPGGPTLVGGDPLAGDALPRQRVQVPTFVARVHPVTHREYLAFLNDLVARGRGDEAERWQPASGGMEKGAGDASLIYQRGADGRFTPGLTRTGEPWHPDWPVVLVDWPSARAFADWRAARDGVPWRLPHELEVEKAARGVDGRIYPWGDGFDPTFARVAASVQGPPRPATVQEHPLDVSVYGVRGLAGNVRTWCGNLWTREGPVDPDTGAIAPETAEPAPTDFLSVRGGAFGGKASSSRAAARFGNQPAQRIYNLGLRLVASRGNLSR